MYGVELYAAVRLAVVDEGLSHREAGRRFGIDRRTVKKMLRYSAPPGYRRTAPVRRPKLEGFTGIIDAILEAHLRTGGEDFDWPNVLNNTARTANGRDRKTEWPMQGNDRRAPFRPGTHNTGGLASSRGCYSNHRFLMILSTYEGGERLNTIEAMACARCAHRLRGRMRNIDYGRARRSGKGEARLHCAERGDAACDGAWRPSLVREDNARLVRRDLVHAPRPGGPV